MWPGRHPGAQDEHDVVNWISPQQYSAVAPIWFWLLLEDEQKRDFVPFNVHSSYYLTSRLWPLVHSPSVSSGEDAAA